MDMGSGIRGVGSGIRGMGSGIKTPGSGIKSLTWDQGYESNFIKDHNYRLRSVGKIEFARGELQ